MALNAELLDLKSRCIKAIQMGASVARIETHLTKVGAGAVPAGLSNEQHLLNVLQAMEAGQPPKPALIKAEPVKAEPVKAVMLPPPPPEPVPEPVKVEEPAPEPAAEEAVVEEPAPEPVTEPAVTTVEPSSKNRRRR